MRYVALIDGQRGAYGVAFPDCPGCVAMADDLDEAINAAGEALAEWLADRRAAGIADPVATAPEILRNDADVTDALSAGAILTLLPLPGNDGQAATRTALAPGH